MVGVADATVDNLQPTDQGHLMAVLRLDLLHRGVGNRALVGAPVRLVLVVALKVKLRLSQHQPR